MKLLKSIGILIIGIIIGLLIGLFSKYFRLSIVISGEQFGSVADWVSGIGSVMAILFVYLQLKEQQKEIEMHRKEFEEEKNADIKVAVVPVKQKQDNGKTIVRTYAYNIGFSAGSFKFIGFVTKEELEKIKKFDPHNFGNDPILLIKSPVEEQKFERIDSREVSKFINCDLSQLKEKFSTGSEIYSVYIDPLRKIYSSDSKIII